LLVEAGSVSQLAQAIEELITGRVDYAQLSRRARERHAELFSDTAMASGVAAVYREVLTCRHLSKLALDAPDAAGYDESSYHAQ
jgi:hypothetical protein